MWKLTIYRNLTIDNETNEEITDPQFKLCSCILGTSHVEKKIIAEHVLKTKKAAWDYINNLGPCDMWDLAKA